MSRGVVYGTPGGSLAGDSSWAASEGVARAGLVAEKHIGDLLNRFADRFPVAVLHDLKLPNSRGNIDHVVVGGGRVVVIDSKAWRPARYVTLLGRTFRAPGADGKPFERAAHIDRRWLGDAMEILRSELAIDRNVDFRGRVGRSPFDRSGVEVDSKALVVVHPSSSRGELDTRFARMARCKIVSSDVFERRIERLLPKSEPLSRAAVERLRTLVR